MAILLLKMEENKHFQHIMFYYFKKGKNTTEMQKKIVRCMEKVLWLLKRQKWFVKFLGTTDILAKQFFAVGLFYALEDG